MRQPVTIIRNISQQLCCKFTGSTFIRGTQGGYKPSRTLFRARDRSPYCTQQATQFIKVASELRNAMFNKAVVVLKLTPDCVLNCADVNQYGFENNIAVSRDDN